MRVAAAALFIAWAGAAAAEEFPSKPIRIVVPYAAGGTLDMLARVLGQKMGDEWGQPVVVDNKPGANGIIGTEQAAKSPADGYTLVMVSAGSFAINPSLYQKLSYDPLRDFAPVTLGVNAPIMLVAHPPVPAASAAELIAYAKATRASSASPPPARGARSISRASCSRAWPASTSSMCPTRAARRRSPTCSAARSRSCST
jgi:tripartite-type tricarboxylate transporter receptor subunit TctC